MSEAPIIVFGGDEKDGPAFEMTCPLCHRFLKFPESLKWKEDFTGRCEFEKIECQKCGPVEPSHIGWRSDFYD